MVAVSFVSSLQCGNSNHSVVEAGVLGNNGLQCPFLPRAAAPTLGPPPEPVNSILYMGVYSLANKTGSLWLVQKVGPIQETQQLAYCS